jgi:hypothetical protein
MSSLAVSYHRGLSTKPEDCNTSSQGRARTLVVMPRGRRARRAWQLPASMLPGDRTTAS